MSYPPKRGPGSLAGASLASHAQFAKRILSRGKTRTRPTSESGMVADDVNRSDFVRQSASIGALIVI